MSETERFTAAELRCRREGYCVFTLTAQRCTMCGRDRDGNR